MNLHTIGSASRRGRSSLKKSRQDKNPARRLLTIDAGNDSVVAEYTCALDQISENRRADASTKHLVMHVDRVLNRVAIRRTGVKRRERSPADDLIIQQRNGDRMVFAVRI